MSDTKFTFRMDFVHKIINLDNKAKTFTAVLEPDPRRYEWKEIDGNCCLYDKLDDVYIPEHVYLNFIEQASGKPIYLQSREVRPGKALEYTKSHKSRVINMLKGHERPPVLVDKSEAFLNSLKVDNLNFVIISLDVVDSMKLAKGRDPTSYARLIKTILYELSEIAAKFKGHVLKYTGDGLLAYFPEPSYTNKCDLAVDCALTMRALVYRILNPILKETKFPTIDIRIGIEAGKANIEVIGSPGTKQHKDIIGVVVSLAAKMQAEAGPGEIYLGNTVKRNLHSMWRQTCEPVNLGEDWNYRDSSGNIHKVYRIRFSK